MAYYAYHRVSTKEQHLDRGITEINQFCRKRKIRLSRMFCDQQTGKNFDRPGYQEMMNETLKPGDTVILTELDRLGRNKKLILDEMHLLREKEIRIMVLEIPTTLMDVSRVEDDLAGMMMDTINNMMLEMYASLAEAEMRKKEKRQREGIEAMKARGEWDRYGRPKKVRAKKFAVTYRALNGDKELIMEQLGISQSTFYRYKEKMI